MNKARHLHRQKVQRRVRDLKSRDRGRRLPKEFCLAKCVDPAVFKAPLDFSRVEIPAAYEE